MVFASAPFNQYNTNNRDKTFEHTIRLFLIKLSWKVLQLNERNTFKRWFRIQEAYGVRW